MPGLKRQLVRHAEAMAEVDAPPISRTIDAFAPAILNL